MNQRNESVIEEAGRYRVVHRMTYSPTQGYSFAFWLQCRSAYDPDRWVDACRTARESTAIRKLHERVAH